MPEGQLQWIKGDHQGVVENVGDTKGEWTYFQSGRRIKSELINEFMIPINHEEQVIQIPGTPVPKPSYDFSGGDDDDYITDPDTGEQINLKQVRRQSKTKTQASVESHQAQVQPEPRVEKKPENPIRLLINQSKKDSVSVNYEFEIDIPKKDVYNVINNSFDVDLNQEIIDVVLSSIDIKTLKASVEESINNTINSYYKSK